MLAFLGIKPTIPYKLTATARLYQAGVDEQLIMEKTGHRSLEGVRSYKRVNIEQQENLRDILSATKRPAIQSSSASVSSDTACQSILKTKSTQAKRSQSKLKKLSSTCALPQCLQNT